MKKPSLRAWLLRVNKPSACLAECVVRNGLAGQEWYVQLFDGLEEDEVRRVMSSASRRRFARREVIFHEGDPADSLHLVGKGRLAVRITTAMGDVATLDVMGPGQVVGELALLGPASNRGASAVALERVETRVISASSFAELRARRPAINDMLLSLLAARIRNLNDRLIEALYVPVETRVARRLLGVAGTTRESVNRILRRLQGEGVVELRRGAITLLQPAVLARLAR